MECQDSAGIEWLQRLLRTFEKDDYLIVHSTDKQIMDAHGVGYVSTIYKLKVTGSFGDGKPYEKYLIIKELICTDNDVTLKMGINASHNEAHFYNNILPLLGPLGPKHVYADNKKIVMEDLKVKGYSIPVRQDFLDLVHCVWGLKTLSTMHARSLALKLQKPDLFAELCASLRQVFYRTDPEPTLACIIDGCMRLALKHLEFINPRPDEIQDALDYLQPYRNKCYSYLGDLMSSPTDEYDVMCHGDIWMNNMMFQHDSLGEIVDLKIIDYQIVMHRSLATDFHMFIYSCAKSSVIKEYYEILVRIYYDTFLEQLRICEVEDEHCEKLSFEWLKRQLKEYALCGLMRAVQLNCSTMITDCEVPCWSDAMDDIRRGGYGFPWDITPKRVDRFKCIILHCLRTYLL